MKLKSKILITLALSFISLTGCAAPSPDLSPIASVINIHNADPYQVHVQLVISCYPDGGPALTYNLQNVQNIDLNNVIQQCPQLATTSLQFGLMDLYTTYYNNYPVYNQTSLASGIISKNGIVSYRLTGQGYPTRIEGNNIYIYSMPKK